MNSFNLVVVDHSTLSGFWILLKDKQGFRPREPLKDWINTVCTVVSDVSSFRVTLFNVHVIGVKMT